MPGFDKTGPLGQGSMTGGGFGYCDIGRGQGYGLRGRIFRGGFGAGPGPGFGRGRGPGRGMGPGYGDQPQRKFYWQPVTLDPKGKLAELEREADDLRAYLKELEARIGELDKPFEIQTATNRE